MTKKLKELIANKWFDKYQIGLNARFSTVDILYKYHYEKQDSINSVVVLLEKDEIKTRIELNENGDLDFQYSQDNIEQFENCSEDDFHTMIAHASIYVLDRKFNYHKEWHSKLKQRN